jgi:hypothetical protein
MSRDLKTFCLRIAALGAAACSSAYAVQSGSEGEPLAAVSQPIARSPYEVELLGADGRTLATYERGDRFYILGQAGDRYSIRVSNPTPRRVEAIISVDGLDVIDGEDADFVNKRGYIVPPGGDLVVDGFRMSTTQVAAFRFGSVDSSYAQLKGKGRNVGVVGVAIFEEKAEPQIVAPMPPVVADEGGWGAGGRGRAEQKAGSSAGPPVGSTAPSRAPTGGDPAAEATPATPAPSQPRFDDRAARDSESDACCGPARKESRPGLGTQWGEERYSAVDYTRFERASATVPTAVAELRYNDAEGLRALGISLQPAPDGHELHQRETADPFPAAGGFATPPH